MNTELIISVEGPGPAEMTSSQVAPHYDEVLDDIRSILQDICAALASDERVKFVVEFAGERWPTDVKTDLASVLEQLPDALENTSKAFEIDFYEQGLERTLYFEPDGGGYYQVRCESRHLTWLAPNTGVRMPREVVRQMLERMVDRVVELASAARPNFVRHPWFASWWRATSGD
jgi:hypothetical protein